MLFILFRSLIVGTERFVLHFETCPNVEFFLYPKIWILPSLSGMVPDFNDEYRKLEVRTYAHMCDSQERRSRSRDRDRDRGRSRSRSRSRSRDRGRERDRSRDAAPAEAQCALDRYKSFLTSILSRKL